jgi:glycopeptide antibiotics resistance protein
MPFKFQIIIRILNKRGADLKNIFYSKRQKIVSIVVFAVYLFLLILLVLFKFAVSLNDIPRLRGINLIPFHYDSENSVHLKEVVYNILVFVPLGVYLSAFMFKKPFAIRILHCFLLSLAFEIIQWVFAIGASDITDLIVNTLGGLLGCIIFWIFGKISLNKRMSIINVIGIVIEIIGVLLLALLLIVNQ